MTDWWKQRMVRTIYRFVRVSRATGNELEMLPMLRGGTITRNNDVRILDTAEVTCVGKFNIGADLVRIYMTAEWRGGHTETVVLGTFIPMVPSRSVHNGFSTATVKLYGRLQELLQDKFATPYTIDKGANAVDAAKKVVSSIGLSVYADSSDYTVSRPRLYGIGADQSNSETDDTKLGMINDLMSLAGFCAAKDDVMGNILLSKYVNPVNRPAAYSMSEGPDCKFEPDMTDEQDITEIANHAVTVYKSEGANGAQATYVGEAWDTDPDSPYSTVSRGYTITKGYEYSDAPVGNTEAEKQAYANERAKTLLKTNQSAIRRITMSSAYYPATVNDSLCIDYPTGGISGKFEIRVQKLTLTGGCPIETELRQFVR